MTARTYVLLIVALVAAIVALEVFRERPLDLRVRLERSGDAPFDAEVFYESLPAWLGQPVEPVAEPAYVRLADSTITGRTYLFLTTSFEPDEAEAERLLEFVARGNAVAIIASGADGPFLAALAAPDTSKGEDEAAPEFSIELEDPMDEGSPLFIDPVYGGFGGLLTRAELAPDTLRLVAPGVARDYAFPVDVRTAEVVGVEAAGAEVLGTAAWPYDETDDMVTLARVRYGSGTVLLASTPLAFTNAALTGDGDAAAYVGAVLDALPDQPVLWDDARKPYAERAQTPLRYVLATPALRGAYLTLLLAGVLYLLFRGRRWQRAVPVVKPPPNAQREFARTVGRLRYVHRDDRALAERMARHVLERLHAELRIDGPALDDPTARLAAARAGVPEDEARALFAALHAARAQPTADVLVALDARIARFFRHTAAPAAASPRLPTSASP